MTIEYKGVELPVSAEWLEEVRGTKQIPGWKGILTNRINSELSRQGITGKVRSIGHHISATQFRYDYPIHQCLYYPELGIAWVQFNTYDPFTKRVGLRTLRFCPDTACLLTLVRNPKESGEGYDWYLLARNKYQLAAGNKFVEFSRGWNTENTKGNIGWALFDRDFPGFRDSDGVGADFVKSIHHIQLGDEIWENTAEFINKTSNHLIVVTLNNRMEKKQLKKVLVRGRLKKEHEGRVGYPNLREMDENFLMSEPMVFDIEIAAKHLNNPIEGKGETRDSFFNEKFSLDCWKSFLVTFRGDFPDLMPQAKSLPELL